MGNDKEKIINQIKQKFQIELPNDYMGYLLSEDKIENKSLLIPETDMVLHIKKIYSLKDNNLIDMNLKYRNTNEIFIIGECEKKGLLVYSFGNDTNKICYWDIALENELSSEDANAYAISDSYSKLLEDLEDDMEVEIKMDKKYLPLGSVVLCEGGIQKLIIIGRGLIVEHEDKRTFFDYAALAYPIGLIGDNVFYFNAKNIAKIIFKGYKDEDDDVIVGNINKYIQNNNDFIYGNLVEN